MDKKLIIGALAVAILVAGIIITAPGGQVKFKVDDEWGTLYVRNENNQMIVGGKERTQLFNGSRLMNRDLAETHTETTVDNFTNIITQRIYTKYQGGPVKITTYLFDGNSLAIERFPKMEKVEVFNASGKYLRYTVDNTKRKGQRIKLQGETQVDFPYKVRVELHPGYNWAWLGWPSGGDSLSAQYLIKSDYEVFYFRLFDPSDSTTTLYLDGSSSNN